MLCNKNKSNSMHGKKFFYLFFGNHARYTKLLCVIICVWDFHPRILVMDAPLCHNYKYCLMSDTSREPTTKLLSIGLIVWIVMKKQTPQYRQRQSWHTDTNSDLPGQVLSYGPIYSTTGVIHTVIVCFSVVLSVWYFKAKGNICRQEEVASLLVTSDEVIRYKL